ncbi:MAG: DUF1992 domain-containing protein [Oscillochloris sp.]|nr:DUF1992 domain-containing protein [Oscillochloris sp.]
MRAAEQAGIMDDLPGAGKPLKLDEDTGVPDELRVGFRMLKSAGFAPPWIELQQSIRNDQARLDAWLTRANERWPLAGEHERARLRADHEQKIRDLNRMICNYNLTAPPAAGQLPLLQLWREQRKLGA